MSDRERGAAAPAVAQVPPSRSAVGGVATPPVSPAPAAPAPAEAEHDFLLPPMDATELAVQQAEQQRLINISKELVVHIRDRDTRDPIEHLS